MTDKIITEDVIRNATSYLPIDKKSAMARTFAQDCISKVEISVSKDDGNDALPPRYQENPRMKSLFGMMVLLSYYLHLIPADENGEVSLTAQEFDEWGEASVMNQLERMKSSKNAEIKNKIYDILDDYRDFYRMLGVEISSLIANKNDFLVRLLQYFTAEITPDALKGLMSGLSNAANELKEYAEKPKEWASQEPTDGE
jgi:hypothetical protein